MLPRPIGASSKPSSAWFSSSSWNARFKARIAAKVKVTRRMLGASTRLETAVGSRPKLNTIKTRTTNTTADRIPVRERNSTSRSFDAAAQAWRRLLDDGIAILLRHLRWPASAARREMHEEIGRASCREREEITVGDRATEETR